MKIKNWIFLIGAIILFPSALWAHQISVGLGLQTIITFEKKVLKVEYNVGFSRVQSFYEKQKIDTDKNREISAGELKAYLKKKAGQLGRKLIVNIDGKRQILKVKSYRDDGTVEGEIHQWPMDLWFVFEVDLAGLKKPGTKQKLQFIDTNYPLPRSTQSLTWIPYLQEVDQFRPLQKQLESTGDAFRILSRTISLEFFFRKKIKKIKKPVKKNPPKKTPEKNPTKSAPSSMDDQFLALSGALERIEKKMDNLETMVQNQSAEIKTLRFLLSSKKKFSPGTAGFRRGVAQKRTKAEVVLSGQISSWEKILKSRSFLYLLFGLLLSFFYGCTHALSPGHGKTMVAAYLIGTKGRIRDAISLGVIVTITHTASVYLIWYFMHKYASHWFQWDESTAQNMSTFYFGLASGGMLFFMGVMLYFVRLRGKSHGHFHLLGGHSHGDGHSHDHDHSHDEGDKHEHVALSHSESHCGEHSHDHGEDEDRKDGVERKQGAEKASTEKQEKPPGFWEIFLLGLAGGIIPCPGGIAILIAANFFNRFEAGLALLIAFSLGLALVLVTIGVVMVTTRGGLGSFAKKGVFFQRIGFLKALFHSKALEKLDRFSFGLMPFLPALSALIIAVIGFMISWNFLILGLQKKLVPFPPAFNQPFWLVVLPGITVTLLTIIALGAVFYKAKKNL